MYTVVLMAALSTGSSAPDCWFHCGCHGDSYAYAGCYGCYGGGSCFGGWGGGYGYGCWGVGYGGYGGGYGGWGGMGSCYGGSCYGCHGCYGCYGCYGCTGWAPGNAPMMMPAVPQMTPEQAPPPTKKEGTSNVPSTKAKLIVEVPTGAKLYVDDQLMKPGPERRVFNTPDLERGQSYYYIIRVEVERDGKKYSDTKQVIVRAGMEIEQSFAGLGKSSATTATAAK